MRILVLGTGRQGRAAIVDLVRAGGHQIVAADVDQRGLIDWSRSLGLDHAVQCRACDASDPAAVHKLLAAGIDLVIDLLPVALHDEVTQAAITHRVHLVSSSYVSPAMTALAPQAAAAGITMLPELGLDPGIDLVLLGEAVRRFLSIEEVHSYAAGFPEPAAATGPLRYKATWNLEGVLRSYVRPARLLRQGQLVEINADALFDAAQIHEIQLAGIGRLEAFANGDALRYAELLGLDRSGLRAMGRYVLRWPGHAASWRKLIALGLLAEQPVLLDGQPIDRRRFLAAALQPGLVYQEDERDVAVVRIEVIGRLADGQDRHRLLLQVVDYRDLETGLYAMNRTVGFSAAIGAILIADGTINKSGLLSPALDVPYRRFVSELETRGIAVTESLQREPASHAGP